MQEGRSLDVADRIISAINKKLEANRDFLAKSTSGEVTWRIRDGKVEVYIRPKI
jgi:hypothetical protein